MYLNMGMCKKQNVIKKVNYLLQYLTNIKILNKEQSYTRHWVKATINSVCTVKLRFKMSIFAKASKKGHMTTFAKNIYNVYMFNSEYLNLFHVS